MVPRRTSVFRRFSFAAIELYRLHRDPSNSVAKYGFDPGMKFGYLQDGDVIYVTWPVYDENRPRLRASFRALQRIPQSMSRPRAESLFGNPLDRV